MLNTEQVDNAEAVVARYTSVDFSIEGPAAASLNRHLEKEVGAGHRVLTDHVGAKPADLTEAMGAWYDAHVASLRLAALDAVSAIAAAGDPRKTGTGKLLERTIDQAEDERLRKKRDVVKQARETNQAKYRDLEELEGAHESAKLRYMELEAEHGRGPKHINLFIYIPLLIVVGIAEALINYESFSSLRGWTPAIATGVTIVVAIALALSAHFWGGAIRHFSVLFDPARERRDQIAQWQMMVLGTLTLSLVLGLVWYARSSYFADILAEQVIFGNSDAPSAFQIIGGSMISNLIVWIVGVLLAYMVHDADPAFPAADNERKKAKRDLAALTERIDAPLRQSFQQIDAKAKNIIEGARKRHTTQANTDAGRQSKKLFDAIAAQDANVLAVLNNYRGQLVYQASGKKLIIERTKEVHETEADLLTPEQYAALTLRLKYV